MCVCAKTYGYVARKEFAAIGLGERDGVGDLGAARVAAEMSVANGRVTARVIVYIHQPIFFHGRVSGTNRYLARNPQSW